MWQLKLYRHQLLNDIYKTLKTGDVVGIEHDWVSKFVLFPHKTIRGKCVWLKRVYMRRVWVYTGFIDEPETQYAELFDVLTHDYDKS